MDDRTRTAIYLAAKYEVLKSKTPANPPPITYTECCLIVDGLHKLIEDKSV